MICDLTIKTPHGATVMALSVDARTRGIVALAVDDAHLGDTFAMLAIASGVIEEMINLAKEERSEGAA